MSDVIQTPRKLPGYKTHSTNKQLDVIVKSMRTCVCQCSLCALGSNECLMLSGIHS